MKATLGITIAVVLIGLAIWFFIQRLGGARQAAVASPTPTVSPAQKSSSQATILPGGLQVQDLVVGSGREAQVGLVVATHYTGTLVNGTKFDSSYDRGQPFAFILGAGQVIKGWDQGIVGMKVGGKRKLVIPPELGYGDRTSASGKIPPNSTLIFEVELVAVQEVKAQ